MKTRAKLTSEPPTMSCTMERPSRVIDPAASLVSMLQNCLGNTGQPEANKEKASDFLGLGTLDKPVGVSSPLEYSIMVPPIEKDVKLVNGWHKARLVAAVKVAIISQARDRLAIHIVRRAVFTNGSVVQVCLGFRANAELHVEVGCTCRSGERKEGWGKDTELR